MQYWLEKRSWNRVNGRNQNRCPQNQCGDGGLWQDGDRLQTG